MSTLKSLGVVVGIGAIALLGIKGSMRLYYRMYDPVGLRNSKICPELKPGISQQDLIAALGKPTRSSASTSDAQTTRLYFRSISIQGTPTSADIDSKTADVVALSCGGESYTWDLRHSAP